MYIYCIIARVAPIVVCDISIDQYWQHIGISNFSLNAVNDKLILSLSFHNKSHLLVLAMINSSILKVQFS